MLSQYRQKRNFKQTPELTGGETGNAGKHRFVVQKHDVSRLHYDFRLELNGVLKSWAVPKGPSLHAADKRLAVQVEDHPIAYANFKGVIPQGNYGAGRVEIWDKGSYTPVDENGNSITDKQALAWLKKGQLKFTLKGKKLRGGFALVQLKDDKKNWLLLKHKDQYATADSPLPPNPGGRTVAKKLPGKNNEPGKTIKANDHLLQLTHLNKIYWPKDNITKGQLLDYYERIAPVILPYLKNRPLSLKRNINGIDGKAFFQKDAGKYFPAWVKTIPLKAASTGKTVHYTICNDKATLLYLANLGCIEMNPWNATIRSPDKPSYIIMDIDPSAGNPFSQVITTVQAIAALLEKAGASFYCKTSGATGMHVYIPLQARYTHQQARDFAAIIAGMVQEQLPEFTSTERSLQKRGNKIYIDYRQNSSGQTVACAYSVRPVDGARVSAPVLVKEIKQGLDPARFTIFTMEKRINQLGDIFYMAIRKGNNIKTCLKKLGY